MTNLYAMLHVHLNQVTISSLGMYEAILFTNQCDPIEAAKEYADHYSLGSFRLYVTTDNTEYVRVV